MPKVNAKSPVKLRAKSLKNGVKSLYLDFYKNGARRYEFLKLYLIQERTRADKERNAETLRIAEEVRLRRYVEFESTSFSVSVRRQADGRKITLCKYCEIYIQRERKKGFLAENTLQVYECFLKTLKAHKIGRATLGEITAPLCVSYIESLKRKYAKSTAETYFKKLRHLVRMAARFGYVAHDVTQEIPRQEIPTDNEESEILYLTAEEVQAFEECKPKTKKQEISRRLFLFSCYTGLRMSDAQDLRHGQICERGGKLYIIRKAIKTGKGLQIPLSEKAARLIPKLVKGTPESKVFPPVTPSHVNGTSKKIWKALQEAEKVDKEKNIHFHCSRHTFATLLLSQSIDIYTIAALLGHADITSTQVYAKVMSKAKENAVKALDNI